MDMPSPKLTVRCSNKLQINTRNQNIFCSEILSFSWWLKDQAKLKIFLIGSLEKKKEWSYSTDKSVKYQLLREPPEQVLGDSRKSCQMVRCPSHPPSLTPSQGVTTPDRSICYLISLSPNNSSLSLPPSLSAQCQIPGAFSVLTL